MRRLPAALLILAGCTTSPSLEDLLAADPIDLPRLEEELRLEPGWIRVIPPALPPLSFAPTAGPWGVVNAGPRPVWIHAPSVTFHVDFEPFVPHGRRSFGGGGRIETGPPPRPRIIASEWVRLKPGERRDFTADPQKAADDWFHARLVRPDAAGRVPGTYRTTFTLGHGGARLVRRAREFVAGTRLPPTAPDTVASTTLDELVLPRFDSPGAPWHDENPIVLKVIDGRRLELVGTHDDPQDLLPGRRPQLPLEAFVVRDGALVFQGPLAVEGATAVDDARTRVVYRLPEALCPGAHRLIARTPNAARFFMPGPGIHKCDAPDGAASAWIEVDVRD
jgi:hypothetical protein